MSDMGIYRELTTQFSEWRRSFHMPCRVRSEDRFFAQQIAVVTDRVTHLFWVLRVRLPASDYDDVT